MTDGEPHVMASPVRLIAPLYQIHPRLARGCGPGNVDAVVSRNIRVRSIFFVDQNQIFLFYDFIASFEEFYLEIMGGILKEVLFIF